MLTVDPVTRSIWSFTSNAIFEVVVEKEDRDAWQLYMEQGEFDLALASCHNDMEKRNTVLLAQAEHLFSEKQYQRAAEVYAKTRVPFEEVTLKVCSSVRASGRRQRNGRTGC